MLYSCLSDSSERVLQCANQVFLPSFAMWALELGRLQSELLQSLIHKIEGLVKV